ncbi:hypothetical protein ElyMa_004116500 [Elysia marginata]|uniref:Uncharacterized protein n=1 Tax=Elysia marginata TaxID=1093978 RepID=A0AAV4GDQ8_9GAST|nr:hypothetical protein ElyMa_004116500 [Elysia marginata]
MTTHGVLSVFFHDFLPDHWILRHFGAAPQTSRPEEPLKIREGPTASSTRRKSIFEVDTKIKKKKKMIGCVYQLTQKKEEKQEEEQEEQKKKKKKRRREDKEEEEQEEEQEQEQKQEQEEEKEEEGRGT